MTKRILFLMVLVLSIGLGHTQDRQILSSENSYSEGERENYDTLTLPYARFHKSESWREGSADYLCFDVTNPYLCPDTIAIGNTRRYLIPVGNDSFDIELNIYQPERNNNTKRPTILFVHGSGLLPNNTELKDSEPTTNLIEFYTDKGYNFISIDYRKGWEAHYVNLPEQLPPRFACYFYACSLNGDSDPALENSYVKAMFKATQDLLAAHRFVHANATQFKVDIDNVFYFGVSTGGLVALSAAFSDNDDWNEKLAQHYGEQDLNAYGYHRELASEIKAAGIISLASGIPEIDWISKEEAETTPLMLMHGTKDIITPYIKGNVLTIGAYNNDPEKAKVFELYGSKYIYDYVRKITNGEAQIQLNSLYNLQHNITDYINLSCPLYVQDNIYNFLSRVRNAGYINKTFHQRFLNFVDSTLICDNKINDIDYGKLEFNGDRFMYMVNQNGEAYFNSYELPNDFTIEASITPSFRRANKSNIVSTRLPEFMSKYGYDFGINKNRTLFLTISDSTGVITYNSTTVLEKNVCAHVAVSRTDSTLIFYVNGEQADLFEESTKQLLNPYILWVGNGLSRFNSGYTGQIEYLRFWRAGLNQELILRAKNNGNGLVFPNAIINAYFDFTEKEGQMYSDYVTGYQLVSGLLPIGNIGDPIFKKMTADNECIAIGDRVLTRLSTIDEAERKILATEIKVYPNPFSSSIAITGLEDYYGDIAIYISSIDGRQVHKMDMNILGDQSIIDGSILQKGLYFITILSDNQLIATQKIVKL